MTLLALLKLAGGAADDLLHFLNTVGQRFPDLAPKAQELSAALSAAVTSDNLVALASELPKELVNIAQGKIQPRDHASDAA